VLGTHAVRVVLVDDADPVRRMLRSMLEIDGYDVVGEASDADGAVAVVDEVDPHVVVVDYRLPGADGVETARRIRARRPHQLTVLYTAYVDDEVARRAADAGVAAVLGKVDGLESLERALAALFPE
jgi:DNA-binding NarL/FixJ family response regulator